MAKKEPPNGSDEKHNGSDKTHTPDTSDMLEAVDTLSRDLRNASVTLSDREARYLVDTYYQMQENRIRSGHQIRQMEETGEPHDVITWLGVQANILERSIARSLDAYTSASDVGKWARGICGIGPILSAGLQAHIDIERAPTVGHIWRFAGLDPTVTWGKKQKRPWNARLKTLCWKIGESFVKVSGREADIYGKVYKARKAYEEEKNAAKAFADQAAHSLETMNFRKDTEARKAYEQGMLPQARIHLRAQRYAVKQFLVHWHAVAYYSRFRTDPPKPYVIEHLGHAHLVKAPNWPF